MQGDHRYLNVDDTLYKQSRELLDPEKKDSVVSRWLKYDTVHQKDSVIFSHAGVLPVWAEIGMIPD